VVLGESLLAAFLPDCFALLPALLLLVIAIRGQALRRLRSRGCHGRKT
jgi:hypothetical protein